MSNLALIQFIKVHPNNWEALLKAKPYCLSIKHKEDLTIFNYNQYNSDFSLDIVKEARGLIIQQSTLQPVRMAFRKFFNYGEENCDNIDWNTARVQEKIDGSLMSLYYWDGEWRLATNGMIDAAEVDTNSFSTGVVNNYAKTFAELFWKAYYAGVERGNYPLNLLDKLSKNRCYTFELCSRYNKVVVDWTYPQIFHTGTRDMLTLEEIEEDIGIPKPKNYKMGSISEVVTAAQALPENNEGYVVVDAHWNRIKVKSPWYVLHHHAETDNVGFKTLYNTYMAGAGEVSEFLAYFPRFTEAIEKIGKAFAGYTDELTMEWEDCLHNGGGALRGREFSELLHSKGYKHTDFLYKKHKNNDMNVFEYAKTKLGLYDIIKSRVKGENGSD